MTDAPRLAAGVAISALIRRIEATGGSATVLARGDATSGAMLVQLAERGRPGALLERRLSGEGYVWAAIGPDDPAEKAAYIARRRRSDPDLWAIELDHREAELILHEILG